MSRRYFAAYKTTNPIGISTKKVAVATATLKKLIIKPDY